MEPLMEPVGDELDASGVPPDEELMDGVLAADPEAGLEGEEEQEGDVPESAMAFEGAIPEVMIDDELLEELEETGEVGLEIDMDGPDGPEEPVRFRLVRGERPEPDDEPVLEEEGEPEPPGEGEPVEDQEQGMVTDAEPTEVLPDLGI
jgi:hypothetical protein